MGAERFLIVLAACAAPPAPQVLCHNANCAGIADPMLDDTLGALDRSLALGPTLLDGVEIDVSWFEGRCVFAHAGHADAPAATEAAERIADYLRATGGTTPSGLPFVVYLELKPDSHVAELGACVSAVARTLVDGPHELVVSSFSPELLDAARLDQPLDAIAELRPPGDWSLAGFSVDGVSVHALDLDTAFARRCADQGLDVAIWTDLDTPELYRAITRFAPRYVSVARVETVRGWLDR